jgi:hypothetical protein
MMTTDVVSASAEPRPIAWEVSCPTCGESVICEMLESDDGRTYTSSGDFGDPFVECECGTVIQPTDVILKGKS